MAKRATRIEVELYGYPKGDEELSSPLELREVTFVASPETLRRLASFLNQTATEMEKYGKGFDHEHFSIVYEDSWVEGSGDVIVSS